MPTISDPAGDVLADFFCGVGRLTLNNPARKNAITSSMAEQIAAFCARVEDDEAIGAVIIDAVGDYFCSGADTRDLAAASAAPASTEAVARVSMVYEAFVDFGSLSVPTVSLVVGGAVGAGLNLALAADVVLVTPDATLESGFVGRHIHPGGGHFTLLGRLLNRQQAIVLGVLGHPITGTEAVRLGVAWKALAKPALTEEALALIEGAAADPVLARRVKRSAVLELGPNAVSWPAAVELERGMQMWSMARKGGAGWKARATEVS
jgi:enoyl-CoA hydratase